MSEQQQVHLTSAGPSGGAKTARHTPGPWHIFSHSWCNTSVLADGFDHGICSLDINHATEESQEADEALMAANAHLIAAAPDLLAALRAYVVYDEYINGLDGDPSTDRLLKARAAIAKAGAA